MAGKKTLFLGVTAIVAVLVLGTLYVALSSGGVDPANGTTQVGTSVTGTYSNDTARITVSGIGEVSYVPDEAIVTVGVITNNATVTGAIASNSITMNGIVGALNSIGITNGSMQTEGYSIAPDYSYSNNNGVQSIVGYTVTDALSVNVTAGGCSGCSTLTLGERAAQVIETATQAGANQVSFGFAVSNQLAKQLETEALQQAVADASSQATTIASAMGVAVTGVIQATDTGVSASQPVGGLSSVYAVSSTPSTPILPGVSTLSAGVEIVYSIS